MQPIAELMRVNHDWSTRRWMKEVEYRRRAKIHAATLLGEMIPTYEAVQVIDNKRRTYLRGAPNALLSNWFNSFAVGLYPTSLATALITPAAATQMASSWYGNVYNDAIAVLASQQLGTDTATLTVRRIYKLTAAIAHTAPTNVSSITSALQSWQGTNVQQISQSQFGHTFAANSTSGNPTIGEFGGMLNLNTSVAPTNAICLCSRLAVADGVFTAFAVTSAQSLLVNWIINYPAP